MRNCRCAKCILSRIGRIRVRWQIHRNRAGLCPSSARHGSSSSHKSSLLAILSISIVHFWAETLLSHGDIGCRISVCACLRYPQVQSPCISVRKQGCLGASSACLGRPKRCRFVVLCEKSSFTCSFRAIRLPLLDGFLVCIRQSCSCAC